MAKDLISVVIPVYDMPNGAFFLWRCIDSIMKQTYTNYEIVITKGTGIANNTNKGIKKAKGDIIKILYMDDYLADPNYLDEVAKTLKTDGWLVSSSFAVANNGQKMKYVTPYWTDGIEHGINTIGAPSVVAVRGKCPLMNEKLTWVVDCEWYNKLYKKYGSPIMWRDISVGIGIHDGQMTNLLSDEVKQAEEARYK
jgi:glycosyltransferase involved in cell wall biosynthesis